MSPRGRIKSKRQVKRAGAKALRTDNPPHTPPRKDGKVAPAKMEAFRDALRDCYAWQERSE